MSDVHHRPRVAVSSCLLGEPVRYDGAHKRNACVVDLLATCFDTFPVCPEVAIGMGMPRPPIQLVKQGDSVHALGVDDRTIDVTRRLQQYGQQVSGQLLDISGYIFKSHSPSCGLNDSDLFDVERTLIGKTSGLFSTMIRDLLPDLPVIDEIALQDSTVREVFVQQVYDYHAMRQGRR